MKSPELCTVSFKVHDLCCLKQSDCFVLCQSLPRSENKACKWTLAVLWVFILQNPGTILLHDPVEFKSPALITLSNRHAWPQCACQPSEWLRISSIFTMQLCSRFLMQSYACRAASKHFGSEQVATNPIKSRNVVLVLSGTCYKMSL